MATFAWFIWKARNEAIFHKSSVNPMTTLTRIVTSRMEFSEAFEPLFQSRDDQVPNHAVQGWLPPPVGHIKANSNVAMSNEGRDAMAAVILRNCRGEVVDGAVRGFKVDSVLQGEFAGYPVGVCDGNGPRLAKLDGGVGL